SRHVPAGGLAFGAQVGEHPAQVGVGAPVEVVHAGEGQPHEDALEDSVAPFGVGKVRGVGAEGGGDEPRVVAAQGVAQQIDVLAAVVDRRQGQQHGAFLVVVAVPVQ